MNSLTLIVLLGVAIWAYKPLRVFLVERTNRTVKILLVVLPLFFAGRAIYTVYRGEQDDLVSALLLVGALLAAWLGLVWLGNTLEKRKPTQVRPPDLAMLSRMPGMPKLPAVVTNPQTQRAAEGLYAAASNPEVQRAARVIASRTGQAMVSAAAQIDTKDVAGSLGRAGGKWAARLKRSMAADKR